ncbi:uncharacterized protein LOC130657059 isoform X2 [Hydractinia symbiolongicarpus]|uniref:uncharacterized protein LOC130657059 isoform X2 n=1 Tax=Hydractinia symbiolongicarpus TaxID=13093 RepID=UPI002549FBD0|nr:uncharacterized protein LOC130657059 isoform X2 [Hydractinia symbiolongicarpus]
MEAPDIRLFRGDQYIQISVRHARTHIDDGKAQFTDYEIELKTNHIAFTIKNSKVRRRYSDFVWLRNRLIKDTMTSDPPTLPGRRLFGRFNKDFIKQRQKKLQEFLFGLVQNNVYLSHAALHLFLQSKLSAEEIDTYLDSNIEEDAAETILAESECKARLGGLITRERVGSKHDSGFSGDYDDPDWLLDIHVDRSDGTGMHENHKEGELDFMNNNDGKNNIDDDDIFNDGHAADIESELDEFENELEEVKSDNEEDTKLQKQMKDLRISNLPAATPEHLTEDRFESSVEYLLSNSSDSDTSSKRSTRSSTKGSTSDVKTRGSSQENVLSAATPKRHKKRRYSRQWSSARKSLFNSNVSLPEFHSTDTSDAPTLPREPLRRSKSFYDYNSKSKISPQKRRQSETFHKQSSYNSDCRSPPRYGSQEFQRNSYRRLRRTPSFMSSTEKQPVKRKISLNEYIIVGRTPLISVTTKTEKEFKTSL